MVAGSRKENLKFRRNKNEQKTTTKNRVRVFAGTRTWFWIFVFVRFFPPGFSVFVDVFLTPPEAVADCSRLVQTAVF